MSTAIARRTRLSGTEEPLACHDPEPEIDLIQQAILGSLPNPVKSTRAELFTAYEQEINLLDQRTGQLNDFLERIRIATRCDGAYQLQLRVDNIACAELAARPAETIRQTMEDALAKNARQLAANTVEMLEHMVKARVVGLIDWHAEDVVRYCYHLGWQHTFRQTRQYPQVQDTYQITQPFVVSKFHDLMDVQVHPHPAQDVRMPQRVRTLLDGVPEWLRPSVAVLTGTQIRSIAAVTNKTPSEKLVFQRQLPQPRHASISNGRTPAVYSPPSHLFREPNNNARFATPSPAAGLAIAIAKTIGSAVVEALKFAWTLLCALDPVVTLGRYVLTGWDDSDIKPCPGCNGCGWQWPNACSKCNTLGWV